ncbi:MAG TPA: glycosyltransferase family 2 protein [Agriterribacter sp.]|nr:glycosyltransferase family 2 protein [Chitinophagaceae bacterium]HRP31788.1 glycosyltransferase family 2 protein [Agriterribacter sp.]
MSVTVICPIYNEKNYIAACIESLISQDIDKTELEAIFVDGNSTDETRDIINEYRKKYSWIKLFDNPRQIVPCAMNIGINNARGSIIVRIDAHAAFPTNYISELVKNLNFLNADNVGAVCETLPANKSIEAKSIATALSSSFGMGNSYFRVGAKKIMEVDTVPFGCFRREIFDKIGLYDEELVRNQDDELNARIIKAGGKIFLIPHLVVKYYARDSIKKIRKMFYQYGLFKPLVNKKLGNPATARQFFPLLFVLGLTGGLILSFVHEIFIYIYLSVLLIYLTGAVFFGIKDSKDKREVFFLPYVYLNIHLAYGWGYLVGIYKIITKKSFSAEVNR